MSNLSLQQESERDSPFQLVVLVLSVYALAAQLVQATGRLMPAVSELLDLVDIIVCGVFLWDFGVRFAKAKSKWTFLRWGWIDLLSSIPNWDPLRWGRLVQIVRVLRLLRSLRRFTSLLLANRVQGGLASTGLCAFLLLLFSSISILTFENDPRSNIKTPEAALWWSLETITTVGYGDFMPVTVEGRLVAATLMIGGVGLFGTFTALVASYFVEPDLQREDDDLRQVLSELRELRAQVAQLQAALPQARSKAA